MDHEASWDVSLLSTPVRQALESLSGSRFDIDVFRRRPAVGDTENRIRFLLRSFAIEHPDALVDFMRNELEGVHSTDGQRHGSLRLHLDPRIGFESRLQKALADAMTLQVRADAFESLGSLAGPCDPDNTCSSDEDEEMRTAYEGSPETLAASTPSPFLRHTKYSVPAPDVVRSSPSSESRSSRKRPSSEDCAGDLPPTPRPRLAATSSRTYSAASTSSTSKDARSSASSSVLVTPQHSVLVPPWDGLDKSKSFPTEPKVGSTQAPAWTPVPPYDETERFIDILPRCPYQAMLYKKDIRFHVQWQLERELSKYPTLSWEDFDTTDFDELRGDAADAEPRIRPLLEKVAHRKLGDETNIIGPEGIAAANLCQRRASLLQEVDVEERSIRSGDLAGCGQDNKFWYGGRVAYTVIVEPVSLRSAACIRSARVEDLRYPKAPHVVADRPSMRLGPLDDPENPMGPGPSLKVESKRLPFTMSLRAPEMPGRSSRLARRFGSRRILNFRLVDLQDKHRDAVINLFMGRCFVLFGRTYRALWAPADRDMVFAIETNDELPGVTSTGRFLYEPKMLPFNQIFIMFNHPRLKPSQAVAKWAARPQILFSDSVPAARVAPDAIGQIDDIVCASAEGRPNTEEILTDGCGWMSESLAGRIYGHPDIRSPAGRPSVVQMRIGGSKGLLALMSPAQARQFPGKDVILRPSMIKALSAEEWRNDPSLLFVDILRCESLKIGTTLSAEPIAILVHNGVPASLFCERLRQGLESLKDEFTAHALPNETEADVLNRIAASCFGRAGVGGERKKRTVMNAGISTRAAGLTWESMESTDDMEDDALPPLILPSERFDVDPVSGQSGSIAESLLDAVLAGFHPLESAYTGAKLHRLMSALTNKGIREFRIPVEQSISAFIVPDTLDVLQPGEIFVSFSSNAPVDPDTGCRIPHLEGPVIAFRSPCKLPTDIRRFTAVYRPELAHLRDCIVMSASRHCKRSPASFLGGGDYDGDTVQVIWEPEIVSSFHDADDAIADTPYDFEKDNFAKHVVKCGDFLESLSSHDEETRIVNYQTFLLAALRDEHLAGLYSDLHGNAAYRLGYGHRKVLRLARMFCHVLDASKSGLRLVPGVREADVKEFAGSLRWRMFKKDMPDVDNPVFVRRPDYLGPFVMDQLIAVGEHARDEVMRTFPLEVARRNQADYDDLSPLYLRARAQGVSSVELNVQLDLLEQHVRCCKWIWDMIRARQLDRTASIRDVYRRLMNGEHVAVSSRSGASRTHTPSKKAKAQESESDLLMLTHMRHLAAVWRDGLTPDTVPLLCHFGEERSLARMKISCAVAIAPYRPKQLIPFDVDFLTTCQMKAEARGAARTIGQSAYIAMKPTSTNRWSARA